ncbi:MAG: hypothetical protein IKQ89_08185 [Muribaculaceae bacterium]|nr:hypothetical protein [Muribaculaceae bacterium]
MKKFSLLLSMLLMAVMASAATTIYIDKNSPGNIWAWDSDGNYFQEWPGVALSTLDVATVDGVEYYTFVYSHEASGEGLIFNNEGAQTENMVPQDGAIYSYDGVKTATIVNAEPAPEFDATKRKFAVTGAAFGGWNMPPEADQTFTNNGDGTYTLEYEGATAGQFKLAGIAMDDAFESWNAFDAGVYYGANLVEGVNTMSSGNTANMNFPVNGNVVLTVSNVTETSCDLKIELKQEIIPEVDYYLVGAQMGWSNAEENKFIKDGDVYKLEKVFSGEFKIHTSTDDWYGNGMEFTAENNTFELNTNTDNMTIAAQEAPYTLTIENGVLTITGFAETPQPDPAFYLIGSFNEWNEETPVAMTQDADGKFVVEQAMEANAEFKFLNENHEWIGAEADGNFIVTQEQVDSATAITLLVNGGNNIQIPVAGTWKFTIDPETMTLIIGGEWPVEPQPEAAFYLTGSFNEWDPEARIALTKGDDGKFSVTQEMDANAEFKFVNENDVWIGADAEGNFIVTQEQVDSATAITLLVNGGNNIQIPVKGVWTLTIDPETMTLVIAGEWVEEPEPEKMVYILGNVVGDWDPTVGTPMVERGEGIYDLDITLVDAYEGNAYIGFTTKLADPESETPWEDIDEFRFGPVSEGDFVLTPELMETDIAITFDAHETVQAPAGKYWILVDFNDMKLIMKRMETTGDVNGDGAVDGNDLNMLINIVLGKEEATPGAEIDGQEGINGGDINTLINILLGKN